jgi:hypothetical protein
VLEKRSSALPRSVTATVQTAIFRGALLSGLTATRRRNPWISVFPSNGDLSSRAQRTRPSPPSRCGPREQFVT